MSMNCDITLYSLGELKTLTLGRSFKQNFELYAFKSQLSGKLSADNGANASENN